jgi:hypothetical protein
LKGVNILRKNCIIVSGLPKKEFPTAAAIEKFFARYGKIVLVVENPKGIVAHSPRKKYRGETSDHEHDLLHQQNDSWWSKEGHVVFISYMNEKSATLAVRDINSGKILSAAAADGENAKNSIHSRFVYSPYCEKFLKGEHCRDLHCVLMHEDVKSNKNAMSPTSPSGCKSSVAKSFKESYRTPPIILKKERSSAVAESQYSSEHVKSTRSFLEVTTGVEWRGIKQEDCENGQSAGEKIHLHHPTSGEIDHGNDEVELAERRIENSVSSTDTSDERTILDNDHNFEDEEDGDDQFKRDVVFQQLIATPDSTLTKSTISSKLTLNTNDQSLSGHHRDDYKCCMDHKRTISDLCAKELFVALKDMASDNCTLFAFPLNEYSPFQHNDDVDGSDDDDDDDADISSLQTVKMCTSPWDFHSPLQLEKDNFDTLFSNNLFHNKDNRSSTLAKQPNNVTATNYVLAQRKDPNESPKNFTEHQVHFSKSPLSTKSTRYYPIQQQYQQHQQHPQQQTWLFPPQHHNFPPMPNYRSFPQHYGQNNATFFPQQQHIPRVNIPFPYPMVSHLQPHSNGGGGGGTGGGHPYGDSLNPNGYNPIGHSPNFWWTNRM